MKKSLVFLLGLGFSTSLFFISCHKDEKTTVDNETQSSVDNAVADQEFSAIVPTTNSHAINTKGVGTQGRAMSICDTLTRISGDTLWGMPGHVDPTFTMSTSNALCNRTMPDGKLRTGGLSVHLTGLIRTPGTMMIIKLLNYHADSISYSCDSMVVTTVASNTLVTTFNVNLVNGVCKGLATGWMIKYSSNRTISFYPHGLNGTAIEAMTTIYGSATGNDRLGLDFTVNIPQASPLQKMNLCPFISSGIMQLTPKGFATRTIDFGSGTCDEDATFSVNGSTVAFKLK